ncbi:hypothetical protein V1511DRAFT_511990 [Dipodascopsis uninucleata]
MSRNAVSTADSPEQINVELDMSGWQIGILFTTVCGYIIIAFLATYVTFVVQCLAAVEDLDEQPYVRLNNSSTDNIHDSINKPVNDGAEPADVVEETQQNERRYVTANVSGTLRFLRRNYGKKAVFRGMSIYLVMNIIQGLVVFFLSVLFSSPLKEIISVIVGAIVVAPFSMIVTHAVISKPSSTSYINRLRSYGWQAGKLTVPIVILESICSAVFGALFQLVSTLNIRSTESTHGALYLFSIIIVGLSGILFFFLCFLPVVMVRVRMQASLLPEDDEQVLPFNRLSYGSFSNIKEAVLYVPTALKDLTRDEKRRFRKVVTHMLMFCSAISLVFIIVLVIEIVLFQGTRSKLPQQP